MLYYLDQLEHIDHRQLQYLTRYCSTDRLNQANRYRLQSDRIQSVVAYILLRVTLFLEHGICAPLRITADEYRKPYLIGNSGICFSLSHCKNVVACALSTRQVGIDVQELVPYNERMARLFMTDSEYALTVLERSSQDFTRVWTQKESYGKYLGVGICYDMKGYSVMESTPGDEIISQSYTFPEFILSVTAEEAMKLNRVTVEELLLHCNKLVPG